jgi:hypothetical protein
MEYLSPRGGLRGYSTKEERERKDYAPNQILEGYGKYGTHTGSRLIRRTIGKNLSRLLVAERSKSAKGLRAVTPFGGLSVFIESNRCTQRCGRLCVRPDNASTVLGESLIVFIGLACKNRS